MSKYTEVPDSSENVFFKDTVFIRDTKLFSVGDTVRVQWPGDVADGLIGTVVCVGKDDYVVQFPGFDGHDGGMAPKSGEDKWYVEGKHLVLQAMPDGFTGTARTGPRAKINTPLPVDASERKALPVGTGVLDYFTSALLEVAKVSKAGNEQHNPGQPLHWARGKSTDHSDTIVRHWMERGMIDTDGMRHSAKLAWRALALLQQELEDAGAPRSRGSK